MILLVFTLATCFFAGCSEKTSKNEAEYKVEISETTVSMDVYEYKNLTATILDQSGNKIQEVAVWSSSNESVASVSDGKIFAKGAGKATISAAYEGGKAECSVTVSHNGSVPRIVLEDSALEIAKGETFSLIPKVYFKGADATDSDTVFTYAVDKKDIVSVSENGEISALDKGSATITVTAFWRGLGGENMVGSEDALGLRTTLSVIVK